MKLSDLIKEDRVKIKYRRLIVCSNGRNAWVKWISCNKQWDVGVCEVASQMQLKNGVPASFIYYLIDGTDAGYYNDGDAFSAVLEYQEAMIKEKLRDRKLNNLGI